MSETRHFSTANEFVTLDHISAGDGSIRSLAFLYELARGTVLIGGLDGRLLLPVLRVDGQDIPLSNLQWKYTGGWIPEASSECRAPDGTCGTLEAVYLTPPTRRGMLVHFEFRASRAATVELGLALNWQGTYHVSDSVRRMQGDCLVGSPEDCADTLFMEFLSGWPRFALGFHSDTEIDWELHCGSETIRRQKQEVILETPQMVTGEMVTRREAKLGELISLTIFIGLGVEARAALAAARDLSNHGWKYFYNQTVNWLADRRIRCQGPAKEFEDLINQTAIYNFYFSQGVTLDTERMVVTSSRSPAYDHTGSYCDHDACTYAFPAVLLIDPPQARRFLEYAFTVQGRNSGSWTRYLDGVSLQPGFALDGLVAPLRALWMYVYYTQDVTILFDSDVQSSLNSCLMQLEKRENAGLPLFSTRITAGGKPAELPYVTFNNILAWRALVDAADLYKRIRDVERAHLTENWAREVRDAVLAHCVVEGPSGPMFCYATDLDGHFALGDDPEGSLLLAAHLEFCRESYPPLLNTKRWILEQNENRPPRSCILNFANEILSGDSGRLELLQKQIQQGLPHWWMLEGGGKGKCLEGWSASAGYLSYSLIRALELHVDLPQPTGGRTKPSRFARPTPRTGVGWV